MYIRRKLYPCRSLSPTVVFGPQKLAYPVWKEFGLFWTKIQCKLPSGCHAKRSRPILQFANNASVCPNHWPLLMVSIRLVTWQQRLGILFLTITALFLILLLFDDWYLLGTIIYLKGQELQTFLHHDNLQVSCLGS